MKDFLKAAAVLLAVVLLLAGPALWNGVVKDAREHEGVFAPPTPSPPTDTTHHVPTMTECLALERRAQRAELHGHYERALSLEREATLCEAAVPDGG